MPPGSHTANGYLISAPSSEVVKRLIGLTPASAGMLGTANLRSNVLQHLRIYTFHFCSTIVFKLPPRLRH